MAFHLITFRSRKTGKYFILQDGKYHAVISKENIRSCIMPSLFPANTRELPGETIDHSYNDIEKIFFIIKCVSVDEESHTESFKIPIPSIKSIDNTDSNLPCMICGKLETGYISINGEVVCSSCGQNTHYNRTGIQLEIKCIECDTHLIWKPMNSVAFCPVCLCGRSYSKAIRGKNIWEIPD